MFCTECGAQIPDESKFCTECGAALQPITTEEARTSETSETPEPDKPTATDKNSQDDSFNEAARQIKGAFSDIKSAATTMVTSKVSSNETISEVSKQMKNVIADVTSVASETADAAKTAATPSASDSQKKLPTGMLILIVIVLLLGLGSCGSCLGGGNHNDSSKNDTVQEEGYAWPTSELASLIPAMEHRCASVDETSKLLCITVKDNITHDEYKEYAEKCKDQGFSIDAEENAKSYSAYNTDGYQICLSLQEDDNGENETSIYLYAPRANGDLRWPSNGPATILPNPNKVKGSIELDTSENFEAYVGEISKSEYDDYVDACMDESLFMFDYDKSNSRFSANDVDDNYLVLEYIGFNTMHLSLTLKEASENEPNDDAETGESSTEDNESELDDDESGVEETATLKSIKATYSGDTTAGTVIDSTSDIKVTATYDDGTKETVYGWDIAKSKKLKAGKTSTVTISYEDKECTLKVKCSTLSKKQYMKKCKSISYKKLCRNPSKYEGKKIKFTGKILQVDEGWFSDTYLIYVNKDSWGIWDDVVYVHYKNTSSKRLLEDDIVSFYGTFSGIKSYTTLLGGKNSVPEVDAKYINRKK